MNAEEIKVAINSVIDIELADMYKVESDVLTGSEQTRITDKVAEILETVNPTHDYPSTPR